MSVKVIAALETASSFDGYVRQVQADVENLVGVEKCLLFKVSENLISNEITVVHFQPGDFIADVLDRKKVFMTNDPIKDRSEIIAVKSWFNTQKIFNMMLIPLVQNHSKPVEYFLLLLNLKEE